MAVKCGNLIYITERPETSFHRFFRASTTLPTISSGQSPFWRVIALCPSKRQASAKVISPLLAVSPHKIGLRIACENDRNDKDMLTAVGNLEDDIAFWVGTARYLFGGEKGDENAINIPWYGSYIQVRRDGGSEHQLPARYLVCATPKQTYRPQIYLK